MYELSKNGKVFTSKFVGTGPSSYEKRIYQAAVSQTLRNTGIDHHIISSKQVLYVSSNKLYYAWDVFPTQNVYLTL
jgi:hypothetical protein